MGLFLVVLGSGEQGAAAYLPWSSFGVVEHGHACKGEQLGTWEACKGKQGGALEHGRRARGKGESFGMCLHLFSAKADLQPLRDFFKIENYSKNS